MRYADSYGLNNVLSDLKRLQKEDPLFWKPSELIINLVQKGDNFESLNN